MSDEASTRHPVEVSDPSADLTASRVSASDVSSLIEDMSAEGAEQFRLLVESVRDYAIIMLDDKGFITSWNIGAERIKGYRAEEIIGQHFSRFYPEEVAKSGKCEWELEVAAKEGRFEDEGWRVRKDGSRFWANVVISRMVNRQGTLIGFAKVTRDLTQRRALEEERIGRLKAEAENMRQMLERERLEQALAEQKKIQELREQLVAVVGHDLRSPLSSIVMAASLLLKEGMLQGSQAKMAARIARSADRMSKMISQLLDFTRARLGGGIPIDPKPVDLAEVAAEIISEHEIANPDLVVRFDPDIGTNGIWDRERLAQVVSNLIANATQHGQPSGPVDVRVRDEGDIVCLVVRNQGPPITPDMLPTIFDPFARPRRATKTDGLGLGLFIVREMVRAHSGEITVQSNEADGTTFTVRLPRRA